MSARTSTLAALVTLAAMTVASVTVLLVTGHDGGVATITGVTGVLLAQLVVGFQGTMNGAKLEEVAKNVNGTMTTLVNAKTQPDAPPLAIIPPTAEEIVRALLAQLTHPPGIPAPPVVSPPGTAQGGA